MPDAVVLQPGEIPPDVLDDWMPILKNFANVWNNDPRAVWTSFAMIIISEIGDKTFLIAAILAMRQARHTVFLGAFSSLAVMSVLSAMLGVMFPALLPKSLTTFLAAVLFFVFGVRMLLDGLKMTGSEMGEEWEEAQKEIDEEEHELNPVAAMEHELDDMEGGAARQPRPSTPKSSSSLRDGAKNLCGLLFSPTFAQAFILTFLGEWGDRSQIATIALAAAHNVVLVSFGTIAGHACCTTLAVLSGSWLASRISIKHITLIGAALFLLFGTLYLWESFTLSSWGTSTPGADVPVPPAH
ncbi:GCR1-dependent translation factor 1 [Tilletia horrida]|uniref:GDT1 family protein n=1 Tax=Tilletia horrida TaxID=155126 RepID=A0AAN6JRC5_9BASI|nr:GCR1-dependent translation factor 1 [Tilletia horrida]KAK0568911.1 GCR1-dependent translation factor 1 [Tilletia horrida]